ncbi:hypothetical protein HDV05_006415 [Chytridiales sp. JEL 0842]|nr:hypothetical protein HDV05_006415 [Chytridiales sp. JEL 0842]
MGNSASGLADASRTSATRLDGRGNRQSRQSSLEELKAAQGASRGGSQSLRNSKTGSAVADGSNTGSSKILRTSQYMEVLEKRPSETRLIVNESNTGTKDNSTFETRVSISNPDAVASEPQETRLSVDDSQVPMHSMTPMDAPHKLPPAHNNSQTSISGASAIVDISLHPESNAPQYVGYHVAEERIKAWEQMPPPPPPMFAHQVIPATDDIDASNKTSFVSQQPSVDTDSHSIFPIVNQSYASTIGPTPIDVHSFIPDNSRPPSLPNVQQTSLTTHEPNYMVFTKRTVPPPDLSTVPRVCSVIDMPDLHDLEDRLAKTSIVSESLAAMALAAKIAKRRSNRRQEAINAVVTETTGALKVVNKRTGERIGGSFGGAGDAPKRQMQKFNSSSTLFVDATLANADLAKTLKCVSMTLVSSIRKNTEQGRLRTNDIFSEKLRPLSKQIQFYHRIPTEEDVFKFLECIFNAAELNVECAVIMLIYIERLVGILRNDLERWYLAAIEFNVSVKASLYARYYFELRDLTDTEVRPWTMKPLSKADASKLVV